MQLSRRIRAVSGGGSGGWDLFLKTRAMQAAGEDIADLTIGEHDVRTDPAILAAMHQSAVGGHTGYAAVPGTHALRSAVAERVAARTGVATTADNVLITPGGQAALFAAHIVACNEGDTALYVDPHYATYPGTIRGAGAVPHAVSTRPEDNFQPRASDLDAAAAASGAASLMINTPNNPTGVVYSQATLEAIAGVCRDRDLWLISDEVYDTQVWQGEHISARALPGMAERTLVVGSMSKSHAMTGSRVGWIVAPEQVIGHMINLATHTTYGVAGFVQDAALFALRQGSDLEVQVAEPFRRRQALAARLLGASNRVGLVPSDGTMYLMLDIRGTGLSGDDFANALLDDEKIAVMPGESFGASAAGHVRVAMTIDDDAFEAALKRLLAYAEKRMT